MSEVKTPWKDYMGDVPMHLDYFRGSMFEAVERMADMYPNNIAFDFMGKSTTYRKMVQEIEKCAKSLKTLGVRPGDKVTIAMPNCPQAIYMFYAVNLVGGIANMIHPLSAEKEIEFYLNQDQCNAVNDAREAVAGRRWVEDHLRRQFVPVAPDPAMDDSYFVDRRAGTSGG